MNPNDSFIDELTLRVRGGDGGNGCVSMRREKFVPRGGPNGGDGGRGGNVYIVARRDLSTLFEHRMRREIAAADGEPGGGSNRTGAGGASVEIEVPVGTIVYDTGDAGAAERVIADLSSDGARVEVARGGRGGRGNARFATATRQTPDFAERGQPGQIRHLRLSLKLLADVGLVGFPNAGKSTLLSRVSAARPRVAAYPFTTLTPSLGVVERDDRRFVCADIPGLIEGASEGVGLGHRFLRHIERTRVLVHLLDAGSAVHEGADLLERYAAIRDELRRYDPQLAERPEIVVLSKIDLVPEPGALDAAEAALRARPPEGAAAAGERVVLRVSAATGAGIAELVAAMLSALDAARAAEDADGSDRAATR